MLVDEIVTLLHQGCVQCAALRPSYQISCVPPMFAVSCGQMPHISNECSCNLADIKPIFCCVGRFFGNHVPMRHHFRNSEWITDSIIVRRVCTALINFFFYSGKRKVKWMYVKVAKVRLALNVIIVHFRITIQ